MACQGFGNISREDREEYLRKKMEAMKKKSEEILRRHAEVEADKRNADMLSDMVSTKLQANLQSQSTNIVKNVKNTSHVQKEKSSDLLITVKKTSTTHSADKQQNSRQPCEENIRPTERTRSSRQMSEENIHLTERMRSSRQVSEENIHPAERMRSSRQMSEENNHPAERLRSSRQISEENFPPRHKETEHRKQKLSEDDGPPPDPLNYLSDPYRDGSLPDVDRSQDSRRHRSNYGGENFRNVKPVMQQRKNYERQHPPPPSSNSHLSMSAQMTGKERKEYENWKAERLKIDEERIARQKTSMGTWKREWDLNKTEQEEAAKKSDKQFYKQPRWISESGDHQEQNKKNQGSRGRFNTNFDYRPHEKGDRSVMVNENNTLTVVRSSEYEDEPALESQYQRNQGGKKVFERNQNVSISDERNFYIKKDTSWKQNDQKMPNVLKGDGWEEVNIASDGVKWDNEPSNKKDVHPLQQANSADREWRSGTKFHQRKNDTVHETRAAGDNRYHKNNSNMDFHEKSYVKRQKSLNIEDFHEENIKQDRRFSSDKVQYSSDGWQGGRYNNGRKYEDERKDDTNWNKSRHDKGRKLSDGWENDGGVNKTKDTRGRIISDGWEKEEGWSKMKENLQRRPSDGKDGDDAFDSSYYDHKQKRFSGERAKSGSFRGNNRIYSSSERGKPYSESRKHENTNQRSFSSSENWQFRGNEGKSPSEIDSQNVDRKYDGFEHRRGAGRNQLWEGNRRGNDQRKASRGQGSRGNVRNAFGMNRNTMHFQEYHNKNPCFTNSGTSNVTKPLFDEIKAKNQVSQDGWECESNSKFQTPSVKWVNDDKSTSEDAGKSEKPVFVNTVENASSEDSFEPEQLQKTSTPADAESHDDSWEDMTSGGESESSDPNDGIDQRSTDPSCIESRLQDGPFGDEFAKGDSNEHVTQRICEVNYPSKSDMTDELVEHQILKSIDYYKEICDTNFSVINSDVHFVSSHNDSIEKILEEVYNDTIKGENKCIEENAQEHNTTEGSDYHRNVISSTDDSSTSEIAAENGRCHESVISSLDNIISDLNDELLLQSSSEMCNECIKDDCKESSAIVDETENDCICEISVLSLDCTISEASNENSHNTTISHLDTSNAYHEDINSDSYSCEPTFAASCSESEGDYSQNICVQLTTSSPVCDNSANNTYEEIDVVTDIFSSEARSPLSSTFSALDAENVANELSDASMISTMKSEASDCEHQKLYQVIKDSTKAFSDQQNFDLNVDVQQSAAAQINGDRNDQEVPELMRDKNIINSCDFLGVSDNSSKSAESKEKDNLSPVPFENILANNNMSLKPTDKLKQAKDTDCNAEDVTTEPSEGSMISDTMPIEAISNNCEESAEVSNEQSQLDFHIEVQPLHESVAIQINKNSNDDELPEAAQDKNITHEYADAISACDDSSASENKKNVVGQNTEVPVPSLLSKYALDSGIISLDSTNKLTKTEDVNYIIENDISEPSNTSPVTTVELVGANNNNDHELHDKVMKGSTEHFSEQNKVNLNVEVHQIQEPDAVHIKESSNNQDITEVIQGNNMIHRLANVSACEDLTTCKSAENKETCAETPSLSSENALVNESISLELTNKLKGKKNTCSNAESDTSEPSYASVILTVESVESRNNNDKELHEEVIKESMEVSSDQSKVNSCIEVQQMKESATAQINEDSSDPQLPDAVPVKSSADSVSTCDDSVISETAENMAVAAEIPSLCSKYILDSDNSSSQYMGKLKETKDMKCDNVEISEQVTPASNSAGSSQDLSVVNKNTLNSQTDIQNKIMTDCEQLMEASSASIVKCDKTKEQILEVEFSSDLNNDSEDTSQNVIPDTINLKDPLARTVRKSSTSESTAEFTEVLEVTTSIPRRIVIQDSDSAHVMYKDENSVNVKEYEQISNSHNLETRLPKDVLAK